MDIGTRVRILKTGQEGFIASAIDTTRKGASGAQWWVRLPWGQGEYAAKTVDLEVIE